MHLVLNKKIGNFGEKMFSLSRIIFLHVCMCRGVACLNGSRLHNLAETVAQILRFLCGSHISPLVVFISICVI